MYERMLDKTAMPTIEEMTAYCGDNANSFILLNEWITANFASEQKVVFPYGNKYGWGIAHRKKSKLVCNVFPENGSFTVMLHLSDKQFQTVYAQLSEYAREYADHKYPCGDGGWIHYRVTVRDHLDDLHMLLGTKISKRR